MTLLSSNPLRSSAAVAPRAFGLLLVGLVLSGCAAKQDNASSLSRHAGVEEASFAAGAGRAPSASTSYSFARILAAQGRDHDALYILSRIIRDHPTFLPAYNDVASLYVRSDRLDDAIDVLTMALKHSPADGVLLNNLGMCCLLKSDHAQALEHFTQAADATPTNPTYRANRAAALALLGRQKEAEADYRNVLGTNAARENLKILAKARAQSPSAAAPDERSEDQRAEAPTTAPAGASAANEQSKPIILARTEAAEAKASTVSAAALQPDPKSKAAASKETSRKVTASAAPKAKSQGWFKKKQPTSTTQPAAKAKSRGWFTKKAPPANTTQPAPKTEKRRGFFGLFAGKKG